MRNGVPAVGIADGLDPRHHIAHLACRKHLLGDARHSGIKLLLSNLNELYRTQAALHQHDFSEQGFGWIDCNDAGHSLLSYYRKGDGPTVVVALNFTPVPRTGYRLGVPEYGDYRLVLNSDAGYYSGSDMTVMGLHSSETVPWMNQAQSVVLDLPPLAGLVLIKC